MSTTTSPHPSTHLEADRVAGDGGTRRSREGRPEVVLEFPDFGFGPAATALRLVPGVAERWRCAIVSTGSALDLARRTCPGVPAFDVDTFDHGRMLDFRALVDREAVVVSTTNPAFARWAVDAGYRVGVLDTLHWLWDDATPDAVGAEFYVAQRYWGRGGDEVPTGAVLATADTLADPPGNLPCRSRRALVTFGGMGLPLDPQLPLDLARWVLAWVVPELLRSERIDGVDVVGGHPGLVEACAETTADPRVRCRGFLPVAAFGELLESAAAVVATPGIATLQELQRARSRALLLPGENMSQVLQLRDTVEAFGVRSAVEWPDAARLADSLRGVPECDGVARVARHARHAMAQADSGLRLACATASMLRAEHPGPLLGAAAYSPGLPAVTAAVLGGLAGALQNAAKIERSKKIPRNFRGPQKKAHQPAVH